MSRIGNSARAVSSSVIISASLPVNRSERSEPLPHRRRVLAEHERARHDPVGPGLDECAEPYCAGCRRRAGSRPGAECFSISARASRILAKIDGSIEVPLVPIGVPTIVT